MIKLTAYKDKKMAVFGLGVSGLSALKALDAGGAKLYPWDDGDLGKERAQDAGFTLCDLKEADWSQFDYLVIAPGVPLTHPKPHPVVKKAQAAAVPIIGDTELFFVQFNEQLKENAAGDKILAITGTNGKSTTTALTNHLLKTCGLKSVMGGNIGYGVCDLPPFGEGHVYVLELSSYQLDLTPSICPTAAALINITPDHLERHGTLENYAAAKGKIFANMTQGQVAVVGVDDPFGQAIAAQLEGQCQLVSIRGAKAGKAACGNEIIFEAGRFTVFEDGVPCYEAVFDEAPALRGVHNGQNAAVAFTLAKAVGGQVNDLVAGLNSFQSLAHRMENICTVGNLLFVNDSKATNAQAAQQSLRAFRSIYWIAGGLAKEGGIDQLEGDLKPVRKAFLIGQDGPSFVPTLQKANVPYEVFEDMACAVRAAFLAAKGAKEGEQTILFAPAAASFDQYANFEKRGDAFRKIVHEVIADKGEV